jgi:GLPGLI family protein
MKIDTKNVLLLLGLVLAALLISNVALAQDFTGIATYKSDRDMSNFHFQADGASPDMAEKLKAQLKKQFQKEFELKFNLTESTWAEAESLDAGPATASAGGMVMTLSMGGGKTYKNTSEKTVIQETEAFSKQFLINDELAQMEWKMTGKTKKIGDYTAHEAVFQNIREVQSISMSDEGKKSETRQDTTNVVAWYTSDIPVPHGPDDYWGLPGLILELNDGNVTYLCTKVVLNPDKGVAIEVPNKGKKVTAKEFQKINDEMAAKMMKKYSNDGDGDHVMTIRMGN